MSLSGKRKWGDVINIMDTVAVTTGTDATTINLVTPGYAGIHVTIYGNFPGSPTDDLDILVYGSLDGIIWDLTPVFSARLEKSPDPNQISITIENLAHVKIHCKRNGSTDTITTTVKYRGWFKQYWKGA